jgi:gp16 family phage-associated protein
MEKRKIRAQLVERGTSYRQWAIAHGYQPRTVTQAVNRWAGKSDLPRGRLTFRILRDLSRDLGKEVVRGVLKGAEA